MWGRHQGAQVLWKQSQCYFQETGRWLSLFQPGDQRFIFQMLKQPNSDISIQFSLLHIICWVWQWTSTSRRTFTVWLASPLSASFSSSVYFPPPLFISLPSPLLVSFTSSISSPVNLFGLLLLPYFPCLPSFSPPIAVCLEDLWSCLNRHEEKPSIFWFVFICCIH